MPRCCGEVLDAEAKFACCTEDFTNGALELADLRLRVFELLGGVLKENVRELFQPSANRNSLLPDVCGEPDALDDIFFEFLPIF